MRYTEKVEFNVSFTA